MSQADFKSLIAVAAAGRSLTEAEAERAFDIMMSGDATPAQMGGLLMALRVRGETVDEITGAVRAMRGKISRVNAPDGAIDTCGTGGDASGTYNISTCAAFVLCSHSAAAQDLSQRVFARPRARGELGRRVDCGDARRTSMQRRELRQAFGGDPHVARRSGFAGNRG